MNLELKAFIEDCETYSNPKRIRERINNFPVELREIVEDINGEEVLNAGVALFAYLADVIKIKGEVGIRTWNVFQLGYPNHDYTDLLTPYYDVYRTRRLWLNAIDNLQISASIKVEIVLNIYFRWYIATIELYRKMLVFALYCRQDAVGELDTFSYNEFLYKGNDPQDSLKKRDFAKIDNNRGATVCSVYDKTLRHALAHGNVVYASKLIAVRQTITNPATDPSQKSSKAFTQDVYPIDEVGRIVNDFQKYAEPCFQVLRVFTFIYLFVGNRNNKIIKRNSPSHIKDDVIEAIVEIMKIDPEGLLFWRQEQTASKINFSVN